MHLRVPRSPLHVFDLVLRLSQNRIVKKSWRTVNVHEAKTHLSRLLERVATGEQIVIAKAGRPVARLVPIGTATGERELGRDRGQVWTSEDFDAPLPDDLLREFER